MFTLLIASVSFAIIVSALCSLLEAALYSLSVSHIEILAREKPQTAKILKKLKKDIDEPITAILTLNTIANTFGAAVAGAAVTAVYGENKLIWFSLVFTLAILLFSEILPKTVGVVYSKFLAPYIASPLKFLIITLRPFIWLCQAVTKLIPGRGDVHHITAEEIQAIALISRKSGSIQAEQEQVITNILNLGDRSVRQVMTPRTVTFSLDKDMTVREAAEKKDQWKIHSRAPVYSKDPDNVVGIVLSRDIFIAMVENKGQLKLHQLMHPVNFVPETAPLNTILMEFFERHQHLFVVVDEYGSVTGVISMEDIIEEIVGREIMDESDKTKNMRELARVKKRIMTSSQKDSNP
ncbi:MAG: hemolysin family protein [Desulfobulbaceae bacterium]|nr:hemolysin family protein [Desulfobulbaceae bacterium]